MRITATSTIPGRIDLSALERLHEDNPIEREPFRASISRGESIAVDDKYYTLTNIQRALKLEWITISDYSGQSTFSQEISEPESKTDNYDLTKVEIWNRSDYPQDAFRKYNANLDIIDANLGGGGGLTENVAVLAPDGLQLRILSFVNGLYMGYVDRFASSSSSSSSSLEYSSSSSSSSSLEYSSSSSSSSSLEYSSSSSSLEYSSSSSSSSSLGYSTSSSSLGYSSSSSSSSSSSFGHSSSSSSLGHSSSSSFDDNFILLEEDDELVAEEDENVEQE